MAICALAWALRLLLNVIWRLVCPWPRQVCKEVCAHTQNAQGRLPGPPTGVSRSAGLAGAAGRCSLSGDPPGPRRGRSLPLNNILPSPSAAVLGAGSPVSRGPQWPAILGPGDSTLPLSQAQLFGRAREAGGEASPGRTKAWALGFPSPPGGSPPTNFWREQGGRNGQ